MVIFLLMGRVWIRTPFSTEKNLGKAYNEEMAMIPECDAACLIDGDVMFLTPDYGHILNDYHNRYPDAVLTCWTNRIHELAKGQLLKDAGDDIRQVIPAARFIKNNQTVEPIQGTVSGFLLVVPKSVWNKHKFTEENLYKPGQPNLLGVDNEFTNRIRRNGVQVLRMNGMLVWHTYRLLDGSKAHLL